MNLSGGLLADTAVNIPPPPTGYHPASRFEYPRLGLQVAGTLLLLLTAPLLLILTWWLQGQPAGLPLPLRVSWLNLLLIGVTIPVVIVIHELIHGLVYRALGYTVTYGANVTLGAAYAAAFNQWQTRSDNLIVALAPLLCLTGMLLPALALPSPTLVLGTFMAILFNIGGSIGDLYLVWRLLRLPPHTLLYDVDVKTMLIYRPK